MLPWRRPSHVTAYDVVGIDAVRCQLTIHLYQCCQFHCIITLRTDARAESWSSHLCRPRYRLVQ